MAETHFDQLAKKLATFALGVLDDLERKELDAGGPIHDVETKVVFSQIRPHIPGLTESLLDQTGKELATYSVADALKLIASIAERHGMHDAPFVREYRASRPAP